jgi:hypothetical protein
MSRYNCTMSREMLSMSSELYICLGDMLTCHGSQSPCLERLIFMLKTFSMYLEKITPSMEHSTIFKQTPPNYTNICLPSWKKAAIYLFVILCEWHMSKECMNRRYIVLDNEFVSKTFFTQRTVRVKMLTHQNLSGLHTSKEEICMHVLQILSYIS